MLESHLERLAACRRCGHPDAVLPILSSARRPRVMLVGQAPGKAEIDSRKPFSGRAGRTLFRWLEQAGLGEVEVRERIHISAMTRCFPGAHPSGRGDRVPSRHELEQCRSWLEDELRLIRPGLVIPVGKLAIGYFLSDAPLSEIVGKRHVVRHVGGESVLVPLPHPSGASSWIHAPGHRGLVERALALIAGEMESMPRAASDRARVA